MKRETIQLQALFYETATAIEFSENAIITMRRTKSMQHHPPEYHEMNCRSNRTQQTAKWEFKASRVQFPFFFEVHHSEMANLSKYTTNFSFNHTNEEVELKELKGVGNLFHRIKCVKDGWIQFRGCS